MTNEERDALVFGVEIRDTDEDGEEVTTLFVDGERVWSDTHFEPEDILLGRDLRAFVKVIRKLAKERHDARAQLAALHAAATAVQTKARALPVSMTEIVHAEEWDDLDRALADLATAAAEHERRVRAPVEAERDQLAAALAEVRDAASESIRESFWVGNDAPARAARERVIAVLASLPADLAAQREVRIRADERAKALREAADECERLCPGHGRSSDHEMTSAEASEEEALYRAASSLRALADEALRSNSDHLSSENASLASQVESMAMRIESLAEELAKPEDVRLHEVVDALDGRAVIFDGLGVRVTHLLDEMDEWIARAGEAERMVEAARRSLSSVAESMTEHAYQELASALESPPRIAGKTADFDPPGREYTTGDALGLRRDR